jgi:hypothetical protein
MWTHYHRLIKLKQPNLYFSYVRTFPFASDSIESLRKNYKLDELHSDETYLEIISDYEYANGCRFIVMYLEDEIPKLNNLKKFEADRLINHFVPAVVYKCPFLETKNGHHSYSGPDSDRYKFLFLYFYDYMKDRNRPIEHNAIAKYLFTQCIKNYIWENIKIYNDKVKSKLHTLISSSLIMDYDKPKSYYEEFIDKMKRTNIFEFIIKNFE